MPIDPNISMSYRGIEVPNPLNQLAQVSQIQAAQQQQQLGRLQIEDLLNDRREMAALEQDTNASTPQIISQLLRNPKTRAQGVELRMKYDQQLQADKVLRQMYPDMPSLLGGGDNALATRAAPAAAAPAAPIQGGALGSGTFGMQPEPVVAPRNAMAPAAAPANQLAPAADVRAPSGRTRQELEMLVAMGQTNPYLKGPAKTAELELAELMKTPSDVATMKALGYPITQKGYQAFRDAQRQERMLSPEEEAQKIRIARASVQPQQPVAPTVTTIVDPTNPNQMLTIDARRYAGGGVGSPGVLGVAGKEPGAALRTNKIEEGKTTLFNVIEDVKSYYQALKDAGDISSTEANPLANVISATQSSALGQFAGRTFGTESQRARENIKSSRLILLNALKQATGKSAQELNSNVELKTNLDALSDPSQGYEAAMDILNKLEDIYVRGVAPTRKTPGAPPTAAPAAPAAAPSSIRSQADAILSGGKK